MAKPKSPLLSLGARGTIGDALTYQKRGKEHIARAKPIPRDPYSLNQAYQRWDYKDYAYLWTLLTNSEKQVYRTAASRYHITGFSQWMKENLKTLPNLAGRWHLDEKSGAVAHDSSRNENNGVIFGASPVDGLINGAFYFDGTNDYIDCGNPATLDLTDDFTIELFIMPDSPRQSGHFVAHGVHDVSSFYFLMHADGRMWIQTNQLGSNQRSIAPAATITPAVWQHVAARRQGTSGRLFKNGIDVTTIFGVHLDPAPAATILTIGQYPIGGTRYKGIQDHLIIYNRALSDAEILRHSQRRYP